MNGDARPVLNGERLSIGVEELVQTHGDPPWSDQLIVNSRFVVTAICQNPGHQNDWHYHLEDECWYVYQGELSWSLEGSDEPIRVTAGDWILAPANTFHLIQIHGSGPAIRLAISMNGEFHRHSRNGITPPEPSRFGG
jgi:quercetin dioxygenase-like cupin family protein